MTSQVNEASSLNLTESEKSIINLLQESEISYEDLISKINNHLSSSNIDKTKKVINAEILEYDEKKGMVYVDVGLKYEGRIDEKEFFLDNEKSTLAAGKMIEVYIEDLDKYQSSIAVSREKAIRERSWEKCLHAFESDEIIECTPFAPLKSGNGYVVDINGLIAFLPKSQSSFGMDFDHRPSDSSLIGTKIQAKVIHCDKKTRNLVVSIKRVFEDSQKGARDEMLSGIKEGDVIEGRVKNITPYGSFINIGGYIDGLLHINDISWVKIGHPAEVLKIGDQIKVKVLKMQQSEKDIKISLGLKQLEENPWNNFSEKYKQGSNITGKITNITNYGIFVGISDGVEGLIHVSEISWKNDGIRKMKEDFKIGQEIDAKILDVNIEKHRISLGIKQLEENPWDSFISNNEPGKILHGKVANITDFGIFVSINDKIDGLVSMSDIAYGSVERYIPSSINLGESIDVLYIEGDAKSQRIRLSIKNLRDKEIHDNESKFKENEIIECKVLEVRHDGIILSAVNDAIISFVHQSEVGDRESMMSIEKNSTIKAVIKSYNKDLKRLNLSISKLQEISNQKLSSSTLGDIINSNQ